MSPVPARRLRCAASLFRAAQADHGRGGSLRAAIALRTAKGDCPLLRATGCLPWRGGTMLLTELGATR